MGDMTWPEAIERYTRTQKVGGYPSTTIATRRQHLEHMGRRIGCGPWEVDGEELALWAADQEWQPETRRGRRSTYRSFYAWAVDKGHTAANPALELPKVKAGKPNPSPVPDRVYHEALMRARPRERLMLRLGSEIGLRRAEVAVVHSNDLIEDLVGWSLLVHGKGAKERVVPLTDGVAHDLRMLPPGFAFPGAIDGHLSPRWVGKIITQLMPGRWTMHKLRHRFATRTYAVGGEFVAQELLGHASPATTRLYVKVPNDALRAAVDEAAGLAPVVSIRAARSMAVYRALEAADERDEAL